MSVHNKVPAKARIRNFLFVIGGGALMGLGVAIALVQYYAPPGYYVAKNVLISPQVIEKFSEPSGRREPIFIFREIEYLYFNDKTKKWDAVDVPLLQYSRFYRLISEDRSVEISEETKKKNFGAVSSASLLIKDRSGRNGKGVFQEVQFSSKRGGYRIQLLEDERAQKWAYFEHPGIKEEIQKLFR